MILLTDTLAEINRLERADDGLTNYLRTNDPNSFRAREWLLTNAGKLRGNVYGPVYVEVWEFDRSLMENSSKKTEFFSGCRWS